MDTQLCNCSGFVRSLDIARKHFRLLPPCRYALISFSWAISWYANFCTPGTCAKIVKHALQNGWDYKNEKRVLTIENGDFLVEKLCLEI